MIVHPYSSRALGTSLGSVGLLISSIVSFALFFWTTETAFIYAMIAFFVLSFVCSIISIAFAKKAKIQIRLQPEKFEGKEKSTAGMVIGIVCLILNIIFAMFVFLSVYIVANAFL